MDKCFKINRKRLDNASIPDANNALILAEQIIDHVWLRKSELKILKTYSSSSTLGRALLEFITTQQFMDKVHPKIFHRGRVSWNNLCSYLAKKENSNTARVGWNKVKTDVL